MDPAVSELRASSGDCGRVNSLFSRLIGTKTKSPTAGAAAPNPTKIESEHSRRLGDPCARLSWPTPRRRRAVSGQVADRQLLSLRPARAASRLTVIMLTFAADARAAYGASSMAIIFSVNLSSRQIVIYVGASPAFGATRISEQFVPFGRLDEHHPRWN